MLSQREESFRGGKFGVFFTRIRVVNFGVTVLAMLGKGHGTLKRCLDSSVSLVAGVIVVKKKAVGFDEG